jgi:Antibiotic biosynthesis monooxygenase
MPVILGQLSQYRTVAGDYRLTTGLSVIAYVMAKPGHHQQVPEALLDLVAETRKEKGWINYDLSARTIKSLRLHRS